MRILHFNRKRERQPDREAINLFIKQELNGNDTVEFTEPDVNIYQKYDYIAFEYHGKWYEYMITKVEEEAYDGARVYGENSLCELKNVIVDTSSRPKDVKESTYDQGQIESILQGTNWSLRRNTFPGSVTIEHGDFPTVFEVLSKCLAPNKRELSTEIELSNDTLKHYLRIVKSVGTDDGVRLEYRGRLGSLKRITDDSDVYTAILPVGGIVEHDTAGNPLDPEVVKAQEEAAREAQKAAIEEDKATAKIEYNADREGLDGMYVVNVSVTHPMSSPGANDDRGDYARGTELKMTEFKQKNYVKYGRVDGTSLWVDMRYVERKKIKPLSSYRTVSNSTGKETDEERARREASKRPLTIETKYGAKIIEDPAATAEYGVNVNGEMLARIGVYRSNATNIDTLYNEAAEVLDIYKIPKVTYSADVVESRLESLSLGDFVTVIDDELGVTLKERVISQEIEPDIDRRRVAIGTLDRNESALSKLTGSIVDRAALKASSEWNEDMKVLHTAVFDGEGVLVTYGEDEPQNPQEGDLWFRDNPDGTWSILVWDGEEWTVKIAEGFAEELNAQIESIQEEAAQAVVDSEEFDAEVTRRIDEATAAVSGRVNDVENAASALSGQIEDALNGVYQNNNSIETIKLDVNGLRASMLSSSDVSSLIAQSNTTILQKITDGDKNVSSQVTQLANTLDSYVTTTDMESRITQTESAIQSKITAGDNSVASQVTQLSNTLSSYVKKADMESRISQTEAGMSSIAKKEIDGVNYMSKINQQAGKILFQVATNKIYISPTNTYMDNAVIGTAQIKDAAVTTAKIAEIDASKAIIKNIDASNITTGTIVGPNSSWNLKTGYFNIGNVLTWNPSTNTLSIKNGTINLSTLSSDVQSKINSISSMQTSVNNMQSSVNSMQTSVGTMTSNISGIQSSVNTLQSNYTTIKSGMAAFVTKNELGQSGATIINGGNVTTGKISSRTGESYLDLTNNNFRFGGGGNYVSYGSDGLEIGNNTFWQFINGNQIGYKVYAYTPRSSAQNQMGCVRATTNSSGQYNGLMIYATNYHDLRLGISESDANKPTTAIELNWNSSIGVSVHILTQMHFNGGLLHMHGRQILEANIQNASDLRLKTDVKDWDISALDELSKMDFIRFRFIDEEKYGKGEQYGISAQSAPWLSEENDDGYLNLNLNRLWYLTAKGVQELNQRVDTLEKENEELRTRLERLEQKWEEMYGSDK